jgi:hypothetical protein
MMMRYHLGLGVGHLYSHNQAADSAAEEPHDSEAVGNEQPDIHDEHIILGADEDGDANEASNEGSIDGTDDEITRASDTDTEAEMDDEELLAMDEMYG